MSGKPVIVVTSEHGVAMGSVPVYVLDKAYSHSVSAAGGVPITPLGPIMEDRYCEMAHGLLLTGGCDIHPARYNTPFLEERPPSNLINFFRDTIEFDLFRTFFDAGKPIMGIGRGHQLINVALGGTLIQDLKVEKGIDHPDTTAHLVHAQPGSILENLFGKEFHTNSFHHQAVDELGKGLKTTATSSNGIVEALEHESKPIFSVQFRCEDLYSVHFQSELGHNREHRYSDAPDMHRLFEHFVNLCRPPSRSSYR